MKELSIIIPVYNVQKYLEDCLLSIYKQSLSLETFEVITVNDGSTDRSLDILRKYGKIYPNLIIVSQENKGQSAARNNGLAVASGKYIFLWIPMIFFVWIHCPLFCQRRWNMIWMF